MTTKPTPRVERVVTFDSLLGQLCGHCMNHDGPETAEALEGVRAVMRALETRTVTAEARVQQLEAELARESARLDWMLSEGDADPGGFEAMREGIDQCIAEDAAQHEAEAERIKADVLRKRKSP